ncbi:carboxymuconolactone decarboxylase family protein [Burkholderia vietnamiensis]|uniref:carboxymuconolactone decarboxylase family protein n=1 Tax=Burkholderia vietnamiensis TaxID=60552 RepID=UPI00084228CB|nr:carboxymuconolactone decarboxylase family protein [Burkholderia vietnamiensis]AOK02043.1 alkylhydroperoxidase [Burkholderia vietnamiensis]
MTDSLNYRQRTAEITEQMRKLRQSQPDLMSAFGALAAAGTRDGALTKKTRELIALGIVISSRCDDCIGFHVQALIKLKATREEVEEVAGVAVYMGGGPSMMYAAHALIAYDQLAA